MCPLICEFFYLNNDLVYTKGWSSRRTTLICPFDLLEWQIMLEILALDFEVSMYIVSSFQIYTIMSFFILV